MPAKETQESERAPKGAALVVGVGAPCGLGAALALRFAREGLRVTIAGRTQGRLELVAAQISAQGGVVATKAANATSEAEVTTLFNEADRDGDLELVVYNVGANVAALAQDTTPDLFERLWRQNAYGGFVVGREATRLLSKRGKGTVLFTGATGSLRARPPFVAFAAAKAALRAVAQGLAREYGPNGIHVAHIVIDGVIAGDYAATNFAEYARSKGADGLLAVEDVADTYWALHRQKRSAWTHEMDLRPFKELF